MPLQDITELSTPLFITSNNTHFYVSDDNGIQKISKTTYTLTNFVPSNNGHIWQGPVGIDSTYLYVCNANSVVRYSLSNGQYDSTFGLLQLNLYGINGFLVQNNKLYAVGCDSGNVVMVDLNDPTYTQTQILSDLPRPYGATISDGVFYCVCQNPSDANIYSYNLTTQEINLNVFPSITDLSFSQSIVAYGSTLFVVKNDINGSPSSYTIKKITISSGEVTDVFATCPANIVSLYVDGSTLYATLYPGQPIVAFDLPVPSFTPMYLGNASITNRGNFDLANTVMSSTRFPVDEHELVPRAYVDSYISSVMSYYNNILENDGHADLLGRVSYLEAQLSRVYKVIWNVDRDVEAIVTPQLGSVTADYDGAEEPNAGLIANPPSAPSSLTGFQ
jgi:hypothetical protein